MKTKPIIFTLFILINSSVSSEEFVSYEKLVEGMRPTQAYVAGTNKLFEYLETDEKKACRFFASQLHSYGISQLRTAMKNELLQKAKSNLVSEEYINQKLKQSDLELISELCLEIDLASQQTDLRVSLADTSDEFVDESKGLFKAKFHDGSVRVVLMRKDNGVWKVKAIQ